MQERKYIIKNGELVKKSDGIAIPEDEPLFILRAKDINALPVLVLYHTLCMNLDHKGQVLKSIEDFKQFQASHPERMHEPDSPPDYKLDG